MQLADARIPVKRVVHRYGGVCELKQIANSSMSISFAEALINVDQAFALASSAASAGKS